MMRLNDCVSKYILQVLQGRYCIVMVKLPTQRILDQREQYRMIIVGKRMQRKRRAEQLSLGNVKIIDLKLIKHDEALEDLKKNSEAPERL